MLLDSFSFLCISNQICALHRQSMGWRNLSKTVKKRSSSPRAESVQLLYLQYLTRPGCWLRPNSSGQWPHPDIPARQMLWILTLACLQFTCDYWSRHICPDNTLEFAKLIDAGEQYLFQMCVGADTGSWLEHTQECIHSQFAIEGAAVVTMSNQVS